MAIDYDRLIAIDIPDSIQSYTERDTMLYALGVGFGFDPLNEEALRYCYEKHLRTVPTMPLVLSYPGFWMRDLDTGIDFTKIVHGEQSVEIHQLLPIAGKTIGKTRVVEIVDKGAGRGAVVIFERCLYDFYTGVLFSTMRQANFCRGDGGFGGPLREAPKLRVLPATKPTYVVDLSTRPESALLYRLSADLNPLHAEPAVAHAAGFPRPILHGLATFSMVGHAILKAVCGYDNRRIASISGRFSKPVFPGETIRTEIWCNGDALSFRALVPERDVVVLIGGHAELRSEPIN